MRRLPATSRRVRSPEPRVRAARPVESARCVSVARPDAPRGAPRNAQTAPESWVNLDLFGDAAGQWGLAGSGS